MAGPLTQPILDVLKRAGPGEWEEAWDQIEQLPWPHNPIHFDREGQPLSLREWATLFECMTYRQVAWTEVGGYYVSSASTGAASSRPKS